jgi:hypothetical protein
MSLLIKNREILTSKAPQCRKSAAFFASKEKSLFTLLNRPMPQLPQIFPILALGNAKKPVSPLEKSWVTPKYAAFAARH